MQMAAILEVLMRPPVLKSVLAVLQLLGTGWGTALLACGGGVNTVSLKYPFFRKFANLTPEEREKMLQGWSTSLLSPLRRLFKSMKSITGYTLYSKINDEGENAAWKAIGYTGMDPTVRSRSKEEYWKPRPLGDGHVDAKEAGVRLKAILGAKGFSVLDEIKSFRVQSRKWGYSESSSDIYMECDVVIVGSGSGGGVMAAVLAKQGFKVLVLEKGQYFAAQDITSLEGPGMVNMYEKMGAQSTDDGGVSLIAGKTVGGGTAVNWCVSFKTPEHVRNEWVNDHGLDLFTSAQYEQAMQAVWKRLAVQPEVDKHSLQNTVLLEGCKKLGYECGTLQRNCSPGHYCGWCSYGCPTGKKQSTAETWLVDAVNTGNAVILSNCHAKHVFHDANPGGKKARKGHGVVATIGEGSTRIFVKANATVIACGALLTPPLLLRSGLKNPNIGKYLRVHPATTCFGYFPEEVEPKGKSYEGGIMTTYSPVTLRKPTEYGGLLETGVFHPAVFAAFHPWQSGADGKERLLHHARTSHITVVTRDKGFGTAKIDNDGLPMYSYKISPYDEQTLIAGMIQSLRILVAAGAVEIGTQQLDGERFKVKGATPAQIEEYLDRVKRRRARQSSIQIASAHQLGSCRMGTSPRTSAVDARGETWEAEGVFVADGSVLPTSSGVNPMVTIQSIAYCTADSVAHFLHGASSAK
uniref:Long-chain-alcohol oxidase n=1 Tax=Physcomitrium patens TaxID=3218 RepID=A0A7I4D609_PHYPA